MRISAVFVGFANFIRHTGPVHWYALLIIRRRRRSHAVQLAISRKQTSK